MTTNITRVKRALAATILVASVAVAGSAQPRVSPPTAQPSPAATPVKAGVAASVPAASNAPQKFTREGVEIEFAIEPVVKTDGLLEGKDATVRFTIRDTTTNQPLTNLRPAAWIDARKAGTTATDAKACREKVQAFLQAQLSQRPDIDLNSYLILALNGEPNISVIDPLFGFGTTKLRTLVFLKSPGEDWVMDSQRRRLYVSMPLVNQVAVVDTATWKVVSNIETGAKPVRLRLQRDEKYLWVGNDGLGDGAAASGVTVIDTATGRVVANIETGAGHHEIAFSDDDRFAFVSNKTDGTLSVVDVAQLAKVKDVKTGAQPASLAVSTLARAVYVADETDGSIVAVDTQSHARRARIEARPGLVALRFAPGNRYGFAVNGRESLVHIFDASTNRLLHSIPVGKSPDQVTFTREFAYVRSLGNEQVALLNLAQIGKANIETSVARFSGGQKPPAESASRSAADAVVPSAEDGAVLVANPADKMIYYYQQGMAAPMGSFTNYKREPRAVLVWDASLRETSPGVYSTKARLTAGGNYDVAFLLDSPRVVNCFEMSVKENPEIQKKGLAIRIEPLYKERTLKVGERTPFRFRVIDTATGQPKADLKDMGVLTFLSPGIWQKRDWAKAVGAGVYEIEIEPPQSGVYYIFFQCPSLNVQYRQLPHLVLQADAAKPNAP